MTEQTNGHQTSVYWVSSLFADAGWYFKEEDSPSHGPYIDEAHALEAAHEGDVSSDSASLTNV
ncbi:MAG: hypothetical protein JMN27_08745 [gamma proteobacterium endosymbiont of Lamellibrachia anaximandri]|nr:hypothetical protein [gamma proteobacterium endosymbiont of Lamellibrachia anaximandri]MBL3533905.1 hypothetical protein [gamma proteobacterium endosymbiont of Lamellibrachia anaximandri]